MPVWMVEATWIEDEADAQERWEVVADGAAEAAKDVSTHCRFPPHHIEARMVAHETDVEAERRGLRPHVPRRIP